MRNTLVRTPGSARRVRERGRGPEGGPTDGTPATAWGCGRPSPDIFSNGGPIEDEVGHPTSPHAFGVHMKKGA